MMPQIGFSEMLLLGMLALIVLGPRDLPLMMRKLGRWTGKLRALAFEFRQSFDEIGRQAELEELRKEVEDLKKNTGLEDVKADMEKVDADISREMGAAALEARMAVEREKAAEGETETPDDAASDDDPELNDKKASEKAAEKGAAE